MTPDTPEPPDAVHATPTTPDLRSEMMKGALALAAAPPPTTAASASTSSSPSRPARPPSASSRGITSDLSVDEGLLLHAGGWEPLDLVCGVAVVSVPFGVWNWGVGSIDLASDADDAAVAQAGAQLRSECSKVHGHGVVGVRVEVDVRRITSPWSLSGRRSNRSPAKACVTRGARRPARAMPFISDLSARDFTLLQRAGWIPVGLAFGASFVYAPRRSAGTAMRQSRQNVELTNYTEAMYSAREAAMEKMQRSALQVEGQGVVEVKVTEGPMGFARHAVGFTGGERQSGWSLKRTSSWRHRWSFRSTTPS